MKSVNHVRDVLVLVIVAALAANVVWCVVAPMLPMVVVLLFLVLVLGVVATKYFK